MQLNISNICGKHRSWCVAVVSVILWVHWLEAYLPPATRHVVHSILPSLFTNASNPKDHGIASKCPVPVPTADSGYNENMPVE